MLWLIELLLGIAAIYFLLYKYYTRNSDYWKKKNVPFIKPVPFLGNIYELVTFKTTVGEHFKELYDSMDAPFFGIFIFDTPGLMVKSLDLIKAVLVKDFNFFDNRTVVNDPKADGIINSHMLFFSKNPDWKQSRNKVSPIFTSGKLKMMVPLINEVGQDFRNHMAEVSLEKETLELKQYCVKFSIDATASCVFGIKANSFENENAEFRKAYGKIFNFRWKTGISQSSHFFAPNLVKLFSLEIFDRKSIDFLVEAFTLTMMEREKSGIQRNDMIDLIMKIWSKTGHDANKENEKLIAQTAQFFLGGVETTSATIAFTLYEVAVNRKFQELLREEIKECVKKHGGITYEAVQDMKFLDQCVQETIRRYPVLPFLDRRLNADYKIPGSDVVLNKGTPVYISTFGLHYDEKYFPNPTKYDPHRFGPERIAEIPQYSFVPFGAGPRNCVGERFGLLNSKLGIIHALLDFEVLPSKDTAIPLVFEPKNLILGVKGGINVSLRRINSLAV